uniref:Uncharacterized protein n=1 Tax=Romanomermis culicivorax TaxID=13658 RepID=A0A915INS6_ROMCU
MNETKKKYCFFDVKCQEGKYLSPACTCWSGKKLESMKVCKELHWSNSVMCVMRAQCYGVEEVDVYQFKRSADIATTCESCTAKCKESWVKVELDAMKYQIIEVCCGALCQQNKEMLLERKFQTPFEYAVYSKECIVNIWDRGVVLNSLPVSCPKIIQVSYPNILIENLKSQEGKETLHVNRTPPCHERQVHISDQEVVPRGDRNPESVQDNSRPYNLRANPSRTRMFNL